MKKRFTLVEVLAVVFLIGILTAIGFGMYGYAMNSAKDKATRSLFARLGAAIESCNTKFGFIPTSTSNNFNVIKITRNSDGEITKIDFGGRSFDNGTSAPQAEKDYFKEFMRVIDAETLKKNLTKNGSTYDVIDSWGETIYYCYPGKFNKTSYDLYSLGPDGRMGKSNGAFSVSTLNNGDPTDFKDTDNSMLCDDIVNF